MDTLVQTLNITWVGIVLVFLGILVLWGMMALLVRVLRDKPKQEETGTPAQPPEASPQDLLKKAAIAAVSVAVAGQDLAPKAAAAAVAAALALGSAASPAVASSVNVNSWQIANRIVQLNQRNQTFTRKPRGK